MKELYTSPKAEVVEFDVKDVITTSGGQNSIIGTFATEVANKEAGWSGLY